MNEVRNLLVKRLEDLPIISLEDIKFLKVKYSLTKKQINLLKESLGCQTIHLKDGSFYWVDIKSLSLWANGELLNDHLSAELLCQK